jgi:hypothetical protein
LTSDVVVGANTPATGVVSGSDTNVQIAPITFTEAAAGAIPAGPVALQLSGTSVFDTTSGQPTITASGGGAVASGLR